MKTLSVDLGSLDAEHLAFGIIFFILQRIKKVGVREKLILDLPLDYYPITNYLGHHSS